MQVGGTTDSMSSLQQPPAMARPSESDVRDSRREKTRHGEGGNQSRGENHSYLGREPNKVA